MILACSVLRHIHPGTGQIFTCIANEDGTPCPSVVHDDIVFRITGAYRDGMTVNYKQYACQATIPWARAEHNGVWTMYHQTSDERVYEVKSNFELSLISYQFFFSFQKYDFNVMVEA